MPSSIRVVDPVGVREPVVERQGGDRVEIGVTVELAGGVTLECQAGVLETHADTVIGNPDAILAAFF